ncbi:YhcB family protein [Sediminicurvatus halobius]|uniref:Z-ring associated protein G n=1 Tax=Sediminicurvatus halobius TaxID=2182432 RepID=A0A2U2N3M4_9GAMM|nr:DUF1043 family protein [Spiribacter halobius]PWG63700.1 hypothetical protein DEM34_07425 [Spiribacter halobius]UEX79838.1 DUF1043 family protein [Spiribacter halobius]
MTQTTWLMLAIAVVAVVIGFLVGRLTAPRERQYQETRSELERTQKERDELRSQVEDHFQHTAALFGNLSRDYRALYLHFAEGARSLGLGEEPARRLIEEARAPADVPQPDTPGEPPIDAAADTGARRPETAPGADGEAPAEHPSEAAATDEPAPRTEAAEPDATAETADTERAAGAGQADQGSRAGADDDTEVERERAPEPERPAADAPAAEERPQEQRRAGE